ncbi:hypothetical protein J2Y40_002249 [Chryseobacterium sp. 2987]|nr:hypothetical protein [Chryseobacterium sp. 2987]
MDFYLWVKHYTTFPDSYIYNDIAEWIATANELECGTKVKVIINPTELSLLSKVLFEISNLLSLSKRS